MNIIQSQLCYPGRQYHQNKRRKGAYQMVSKQAAMQNRAMLTRAKEILTELGVNPDEETRHNQQGTIFNEYTPRIAKKARQQLSENSPGVTTKRIKNRVDQAMRQMRAPGNRK
jgi:hypothetical protein